MTKKIALGWAMILTGAGLIGSQLFREYPWEAGIGVGCFLGVIGALVVFEGVEEREERGGR